MELVWRRWNASIQGPPSAKGHSRRSNISLYARILGLVSVIGAHFELESDGRIRVRWNWYGGDGKRIVAAIHLQKGISIALIDRTWNESRLGLGAIHCSDSGEAI